MRKRKQNYKSRSTAAGFTLVETLVALSVLAIALSGVVIMSLAAIGTARFARENLIASQLAQEGLEVVRNIRDSDFFAANSFGMSLPLGDYRVQWDSTALLPLAGNPKLKVSLPTGLYSYDTGAETIFSRKINIGATGPRQLKITAVVQWHADGRDRVLEVENRLYDWF